MESEPGLFREHERTGGGSEPTEHRELRSPSCGSSDQPYSRVLMQSILDKPLLLHAVRTFLH